MPYAFCRFSGSHPPFTPPPPSGLIVGPSASAYPDEVFTVGSATKKHSMFLPLAGWQTLWGSVVEGVAPKA